MSYYSQHILVVKVVVINVCYRCLHQSGRSQLRHKDTQVSPRNIETIQEDLDVLH